MSFFDNSKNNIFFSNLNTIQKLNPFTTSKIDNNNNQIKNLFTSTSNIKKAKNIFSINDNNFSNINSNKGIFSFSNNKQNNIFNYNDNISSKIIFTDSNDNKNNILFQNKNKKFNDYTIGTSFSGKKLNLNKESFKFMSITFLPEFNYASNEELRLADLEKKITGNINRFKIKNTSIKNNNYFSSNDNLNKNNNIFNNGLFSIDPGNKNYLNNQIFGFKKNIFLENSVFNNNKKEININNDKNDTLFISNKINDNKNNNDILFKKINIFNSPFSNYSNINDYNYFGNSPNKNDTTFYNFTSNNNNLFDKNNDIFSNSFLNNNYFIGNKRNINDHINNNSNLKDKKSNSDEELDIFKFLCKEGKLSPEINDAIQKGKTVKEFIEDLEKKFKIKENADINNSNYKDNNFDKLDFYGSFLNNEKKDNGITSIGKNMYINYENDNLNLSPIKLTNSFNEVQCYNMVIDNDFNYDKLSSKINDIYREYEKSKNDYNNNKFLSDNKMNNNNIKSNSYQINNYKNKSNNNNNFDDSNDNYLSKTFSNGFHNTNSSLLKSPFYNPNNSYDKNNNIIGRDEDLYQKNLLDLKKLSECDVSLSIKENENNNISNNNEKNIISYNNENKINDCINQDITSKKSSKINLDESSSTSSRQIVDLTIKYHLPKDFDNKNNKNIKYYNIYLNNINQLIKVKDLRQEIKSLIYKELKNKNIQNYTIQKIALLIPLGFLSDEKLLLDYKLRHYNYTIQALITYKKNIINNNNNELAPYELVPKLDKPGYKCSPNIMELCRKTCNDLKKIENFKIFNQYGEVEFKEPVNLLGINLNDEIIIEKGMIETGNKLNYWSIFKLYNFNLEKNEIELYINKINQFGGKFISYDDNELIWEYKSNNGK